MLHFHCCWINILLFLLAAAHMLLQRAHLVYLWMSLQKLNIVIAAYLWHEMQVLMCYGKFALLHADKFTHMLYLLRCCMQTNIHICCIFCIGAGRQLQKYDAISCVTACRQHYTYAASVAWLHADELVNMLQLLRRCMHISFI